MSETYSEQLARVRLMAQGAGDYIQGTPEEAAALAAVLKERDALENALKALREAYAYEPWMRSEMGFGDEEIEFGKAAAERLVAEVLGPNPWLADLSPETEDASHA